MLITATLPASLGIRVLAIDGGAGGGVQLSLASSRPAAPCPACGASSVRNPPARGASSQSDSPDWWCRMGGGATGSRCC